MAQKFLTDIEVTQGLVDSSGDLGVAGQVLSSTGTATNWITNEANSTVVYQDGFTGDNSTVDFTLSVSVTDENITQVYLDGVYQHKDTYSVSNTTLTFSTAPPLNADIEVITFSTATTADDLQAGVMIIPVKNTHTASIAKGEPVYITGNVGSSARLQIAPADASNSAKMPAAGLLLQTLAVNAEGYVVTGGYLRNITTDTIDGTSTSSNDTVYVKSGGGLTMTKPTGTNLIQNIAKVARVASGNAGSLIVSSILRTNDVPNLTIGKIWVGSANNTIESGTLHLDESNNRLGINNNSPSYSLDVTGDANISNNVIVGGNLTVQGTETILNTQTVEVEDNILQLNTTQGSPDTATATTSGISVYRGNGVTQASFIFDDADDTWDLTDNLVVAGDVSIIGGDITLGSDSIASNINSLGDVLVLNVDSNANTGGSPNMQFKVSGTTELTLNSTTATFAGDVSYGGTLTSTGSTTVPAYFRSTASVSYIQLQNSSTGTSGTSDGLTVGVNGNNAYVWSRENASLLLGTNDTTALTLDNSQNATFVGNITTSGNINAGSSNYLRFTAAASGSDASVLFGNTAGAGGSLTFKRNSDALAILRLDADGKVGIGTTLPSGKLHVHGGDASIYSIFARSDSKWMYLHSGGTDPAIGWDTGGAMRFGTATSNVGAGFSEKMRIDSSGNVGIGQTSIPTNTRLSITGTNNYTLSSSSGMGGIKISGTTAGQGNYTSGIGFAFGSGTAGISGVQGTADNDTMGLAFFTHPSGTGSAAAEEKMRINYLGNVGIGTTSPNDALEVAGNNSTQHRIRINNAGTGTATLAFMQGTTFKSWVEHNNATGNFDVWQYTNNPMRFATNNTERMRIDSSGNSTFYGNVTINKAANPTKLQIGSSLADDPFIHFQTDGENYSVGVDRSDSNKFKISNGSTVATNTRITLNTAGNVGIGTTSPACALDIAGGAISIGTGYNFDIRPDNDGNWGFSVQRTSGVDDYNTRMKFYPVNGTTRKLGFWNSLTSSWVGYFDGSTNSNNNFIINGGSVGIGTTSPAHKLDVAGSGKFQPGIADGDALVTIAQTNSNAYVHAGLKINAGNTNPFYIYQSGSSNTLRFNYNSLSDAGGQMVITDGGNVGIGTASPARKLYVGGAALIDGIGNTNKGTLMLGPQTGGAAKWSVITGSHYNATSGSGNGSGSAGIMMIGTYAGNGENNIVIGGSIYEANAATSIQFWTHTTDTSTLGGSERMRIDSQGRVGIGTSSPNARLSLGNASGQQFYVYEGGNVRAGLGVDLSGSSRELSMFCSSSTGYSDGNISFGYRLESNGAYQERMRLTSAGSLGIGYTSPQFRLHVVGASATEVTVARFAKGNFADSGGHTTIIGLGCENTASWTKAALAFERTSSYDTGKIHFLQENTYDTSTAALSDSVMTIDRTGNVGIGTTSPQGKLEINLSGASNQLLLTQGTTDHMTLLCGTAGAGIVVEDDNYFAIWHQDYANRAGQTGLTERMRIDSSGRVCIDDVINTSTKFNIYNNNSSLTYAFGIESTQYAGTHAWFRGSAGTTGTISYSGTSTSYNTSSDYRLKENVVEMTGALDRVNQLKPSRFNFISDTDTIVDGFLAHEVSSIVPEAITGEKDEVDAEGNPVYQGIDQSKLVPLLVGAIKELKAEVETLKNQINGIN